MNNNKRMKNETPVVLFLPTISMHDILNVIQFIHNCQVINFNKIQINYNC